MFVLKAVQSTSNVILKQFYTKIIPITYIHSQNVLSAKTDDYIDVDIRGEVFKFPFVWLRDNCQCDKCFHPTAKSRIVDWSQFNINVKPKNVNKNAEVIQVVWDDGHVSEYKLDWLKVRNFTEEFQKIYNEKVYRPPKITWEGKDFNKICSIHDYNEILESDRALYDWLYKLSVYGVAVIKNTPNSETAIDRLVEKVGFLKKTHYGSKFIVQNVANTNNVAYLSSNLQMHTDLPYYEYMPGVNVLHCVVQSASRGGLNTLSDSHYVANHIKEHHPEQHKLLTDIEVEWTDLGVENGNEFFKLQRSPIINLDNHGEIKKICFSIPQRGSHFPGPIASVKPWYEAYSLFYELSNKFAAEFKSEPGDILVFDNIRLLHGRNGYEDTAGNVRKLFGGYMDWDEIYSRLRCLQVKLKHIDCI